MTNEEAKARWICCPMCDKSKCERRADDCDVKRYLRDETESEEINMEFSYKPVNPFQDDELSKEDRAMIDGMRNTAYICGYSGGDVEFKVEQALKHMGRYDLLPPCEQESEEV